jgi:hypothetical protein
MVLFDPDLNEAPGLSSVDLPALTGDAVCAKCFQTKIILDRPKENADFLKQVS